MRHSLRRSASEQAIAAYNAALSVFTENAFPVLWAKSQNSLGNAWRDRTRGSRDDNLKQAIAAYEAALRVFSKERFPQDWAVIQNNLEVALKNLGEAGG